jgi:hypothetical protein
MAPNDFGFRSAGGTSFYRTLTEAINDIIDHGYDSSERVLGWIERIRAAAEATMTPPDVLERTLVNLMRSIYQRQVDTGRILERHPGVSRFTLQKVAPKLRAELDRRIMASAGLIKLNREQTIQETLQRFSGWATSIPIGGTDAADRRDTKDNVRKSLSSLPFRERRVLVDQGHKFVANLNDIIANDNGAIALVWHSHWRDRGYNYREDHKERDGLVYLIRDNWAQERGLVKVGSAGYYDEITAVGEEVSCRCWAQYLYALRRLPDDMLTERGRVELGRVNVAA